MTPDQIQRVRGSYSLLLPQADAAGALFYSNLFDALPSVRPLFRSDAKAQGHRLMQAVGSAIGLLERPQVLLPMLRQLGARHRGYGVQPEHYSVVGEVLLTTLRQGLGDAFDDATREAWGAMYKLIAATMQETHQPLAA